MADKTLLSRLYQAPGAALGLVDDYVMDKTDGLVLALEGFIAGWVLGIMRAKNNPYVGWHGLA